MSVCVKAVVLFVVYLVVVVAVELDCDDYGDACADHEQCCGGCCFYGECVDTYRSCLSTMDVCEDHVCLGEEECIVYVPPECSGCEPLPLCRMPGVYP
ncbi:hypothetical protein PYW08_013597 [Mythimna loreyi]|uniref:Uncharacterized protein n=1 Tax=Mythimna loreyi TaxID=667449 RepID=A0ACC2QH82_9NEOP|nr:hypothetical protein PYW08_013597 [Mythimna loreyi]